MNIPDNIKSDIMKSFRTENNLKKAIINKRFYLFDNFNLLQTQKIFNVDNQIVMSETNSKKHYQKILDMLKSNFISEKTNIYSNLLLSPIFDIKLYNVRKESLMDIDFDFNEDDIKKIKEILNDISNIDNNIFFDNRILTLSKVHEDILYKEFKINATTVNKNELEEMMQTGDLNDVILISDESLFIEIPVYDFKSFLVLLHGNIIKKNSGTLLKLIELFEIIEMYFIDIKNSSNKLMNVDLSIVIDLNKLKEKLNENLGEKLNELTDKALRLDEEAANINKELKDIISKKQLSLQGDELLELLNSGDMKSLQQKFDKDIKYVVSKKEREIIDYFKENKISIDYVFEDNSYPLKLSLEIKDELLKKIDLKQKENKLESYNNLGAFDFEQICKLWDIAYFFDFLYGIDKFSKKYQLSYPTISDENNIVNGRNIYLNNPMPVCYAIGSENIGGVKLKKEKVSVLTGANSGGKTTLLEMFLQCQILTSMGLKIPAESESAIKIVDEIIYLKKFTGTQGSGAFEQTIRNLLEIIERDTSKLLLIDEFEAITEPGAAAKILINFLEEMVNTNSLCISVSHLGYEIQEYIHENKIEGIRIDGISATGLDDEGNLVTKHQPEFYSLGKSTPELILKRILQDEKFWKNKSEKTKILLQRISK